MSKEINAKELATIYIISKGRPQCKTAQTLTKMAYPGEWFIVCGNNDEKLDEYIAKWGDKVKVFDWYEEIKHTDVMDNFGFQKMASGASPVRNAVFDISRSRGEKRHWQLDDDFTCFRMANIRKNKNVKISGNTFYYWLSRIAMYAESAKLANIGIVLAEEAFTSSALRYKNRVYAAHNMSNDVEITPKWKGRFNDDTIHAISVFRSGYLKEMALRFLCIDTPLSQQEKGGLTDMYQLLGTVRKTAYLILMAPNAAKLTIRHGRYHHIVDWSKLVVKVLNEKYRK